MRASKGRIMQAIDRVMVVEDDANCRSALAELLRVWGYQPETASDGIEALHKFHMMQPTAIISDLQMPGLSGIELFKAVRRSAPRVCCILVTGDPSDKAEVLSGLGIADCLHKPLDPQRLRQDLQNWIEASAENSPS